MFTEENIQWQFIDHPEFKEAVYKKYTDGLSPENWEDRVVALLNDYGYTIEITRPYKSEKYQCIVEVELSRNGEWMYGLQTHERGAVEQGILSALSEDEIIFD